MQEISGAGVYTAPAVPAPNHWAEHFAVAELSVGTYSIPAGGTDDQNPHTEAEIYVVTSGRATVESDGQRLPVGPGSVVFVGAGEVHRFTRITEDLAALVLFAPAYGSRGPATG